ncbi:MAG: hypothetical protein JWO31_1662 [Phycisphaerales bacterium]|nr:hypothetical protein [Phycisphaerales bacterium]
MTGRPTLEYRPSEPAAPAARASDYVVASLGALLVFFGAAVLLSFGVRSVIPQYDGLGTIAAFVLALAAAASSFFGSIKRARVARGRKP